MKPLLVFIDLQHDFLKSPGLHPNPKSVVGQAATLLKFCRRKGIGVAHVRMKTSRDPDNRMPHWKRGNIWLCEPGTTGYEPPAVLTSRDGEPIIHKTGYSGFTSPALRNLLRKQSIDLLVVAGVKTHACVRQTALDAWQEGFAVWIAEDAIASDEPLHAIISRQFLEERGIEFVTTAELSARLSDLKLVGKGQRQEKGEARSPSVEPVPNTTGPSASLQSAKLIPICLAHESAPTWCKTPIARRVELVHRLVDSLAKRTTKLTWLMAQEIGKPVRFGHLELKRTIEALQSIARRAQELDPIAVNGLNFVVKRQPHGVVAAITPWNNPVYIALGKIAPAVLYGNTVVWKPAPEALGTSRCMAECFDEAEWPKGLVNLMEGGRREAETLMRDARISAVTITGSCTAGYSAQEICAERYIPLQAELGGNNAAIIWPDADLQNAASMVASGAFAIAGQRCTANRRAIVHEACYQRFIELLVRETAALSWGDPLSEEVQIGPLVNSCHRNRVAATVKRAASECGAPLLPLGKLSYDVLDVEGRYYPPTILCCDDPDSEIIQEETFGPVLVVQAAKNLDCALQLCNGVRQGLAAAIFTTSHEIAQTFLEKAQAGVLKVNQSTADASVDAPFGGWKASGIGPPEHGSFDIDFFTRPQTVYGCWA